MARSLQSPYMSLLQSIVEELDGELTRLHALRSIVAGLGRTPKAVARLISSPVVVAQGKTPVTPAASPAAQRKPSRQARTDAGEPRERRPSKPRVVAEPRAFAATIPSGPVVFTPARLAEEKAKREQGKEAQIEAEPVQTAEDLDALSRSLAARWSTGMVQ